MKYSIIIPVFNRPDEIEELLESLLFQSQNNFEVIVVEDGSKIKCEHIIAKYSNKIDIKYFFKHNSGPGLSRNYGMERASGDYFLILDSDCIIPKDYIKNINEFLNQNYVDAIGGPDKAHHSFSNTQKAINYSMTSFFTTGGIRGGKKKLDKFFPRSFNMGISKDVFEKTGGFDKIRFGEDIDFSIRILKNNFKTSLVPDAYVFHKRRTDFKKFFKQVYNSGIARINLYKRYPDTLKVVHLLPAVFTIGLILFLIGSIFTIYALTPIILFMAIILIDSLIMNQNLIVALKSIPASIVQLTGYGFGFLHAFWRRIILQKDEFNAFKNSFYK